MTLDASVRQLATDPTQSFIVQAPAGSGKTEILTQRFIRLLTTVEKPEQIIAITFTRKAAHEMRERILGMLRQAASGIEPTASHQKQTYLWACQALTHDRLKNWQIIENPSRLQIQTIDALCQRLAQSVPKLEQSIPYAQISDLPKKHYLQAAQNCFDHAKDDPDYQPALTILLKHLDNQIDRLIHLFSDLLTKRDQWLNIIYHAQQQTKNQFELALAYIQQEALEHFNTVVPQDLRLELEQLINTLAPIIRIELFNLSHLDIISARILAQLVLTKQNTFRKRFDHYIGFKKGLCSDEQYYQLKSDSEKLLEALDSTPDCLDALLRIQQLPDPHYTTNEWAVLQSLLTLLPLLAAHLHLVFNEHSAVDFIELAGQAYSALGTMDEPTDLNLYWDYRIKHLLIDEFQDTSIQQFQLLNLLTQGFDTEKTLFVVGDPMQSIYRFRGAEVGLFLKAQKEGIGNITLKSLQLTANFRATPTLVNWVNRHFKTIFPKQDEITLGGIRFHSAIPEKSADDQSEILAISHANAEEETRNLVASIEHILHQYPQESIALLVRSRSILKPIIQLLKQKNIPYQGKAIHLLAQIPLFKDLLSLTQALLMPGNRLAWLNVLRAPWCGLDLNDLYCIANAHPKRSIYYTLSQLNLLNPNNTLNSHETPLNASRLSQEGYQRANTTYQILHQALAQRQQFHLVTWLQNIFDQLLPHAKPHSELEQFWNLISQFEQDGIISDWDLFIQSFETLYSEQSETARLQIMTIHKSKGLEFDNVFLAGLSTQNQAKDRSLFRFLQLPNEKHHTLTLISPMKGAHEESNKLYDYIGSLDAQKEHFELQRLLYVAVTRAKKRLFLFDKQPEPSNLSFRALLKNQVFELQAPTNNNTQTHSTPLLKRVKLACLPTIQPQPFHIHQSFYGLEQTNPSHLLGQIIHLLLQWIGEHHPTSSDQIPWEIATDQLQKMGLNTQHYLLEIQQSILAFLNHPIGQWIMQPRSVEYNEYAILTSIEGEITTRIIDRLFIENNTLWIIDYKTGLSDDKSQQKHQNQLNEYAILLNSIFKPSQIQCGIFYLNQPNPWIYWNHKEHIEDINCKKIVDAV